MQQDLTQTPSALLDAVDWTGGRQPEGRDGGTSTPPDDPASADWREGLAGLRDVIIDLPPLPSRCMIHGDGDATETAGGR